MTNERASEENGRAERLDPATETGRDQDRALMAALDEVDELLPRLGRPAPPDLVERVLARLAAERDVDGTKQNRAPRIFVRLGAVAAAAAAVIGLGPIIGHIVQRGQDASSSKETACHRQYPNGSLFLGDATDSCHAVKVSSDQAAQLAVVAATRRFSGAGYKVTDRVLTTQVVAARYISTWTVFLSEGPEADVRNQSIPSVLAIVSAGGGGQVTVTRLAK